MPARAPTPAPAPASSSAASGPPRGLRAAWLLAAFAVLLSCGLPWACNIPLGGHQRSPVTTAMEWADKGDRGDKVLALSIALPILLLTGVAAVETRRQRYSHPTRILTFCAFLSLIPLAIGAFGDKLTGSEFHSIPNLPFEVLRPVPIRFVQGVARPMLRVLVLLPALALVAFGFATRGRNTGPLVARSLAAQTAAALALLWAPCCDLFGWWAGVAASAVLALLAPLVPDDEPSVAKSARRTLAMGAAAWLVATAAFALPQRGRYEQVITGSVSQATSHLRNRR